MMPKRTTTLATLAGILLATNPSTAGVVFSASFETPVVNGFDDDTVPATGWIGSTFGFGASNRGLYNETVAWPATPVFSTPFGNQAYLLNYTNSGLTTAVGATGQTLTADTPYKVSFNAGVATGTTSGTYSVQLVAFSAADNNSARTNCQTPPGTVLAIATGTVTTNDMSATGQLTFTAAAGNAHLGKDLGIRLIKGSNSVLYDNIRLVTGHDMLATPSNGVTMPSGNTVLSWTNMPPNSGTDTYVDVWFGTNPAALTQIVDGALTSTTTANAPSAATYYWRVDSYPDGNPNGTPVTGDLFSFIVIDTDGDGLPDAYESANTDPTSPTALAPSSDLDVDGLTAVQEYGYGTNPNDNDSDNDTLLDGPELTGVGLRPATSPVDADSDDDGLNDGIESNTGIWVGAADTGTNPKDNDKDKDGLLDGAENKTGIVVGKTNAGTDPFVSDTDNDGVGDYYEVVACFTSPFNPSDKPRVPYPLPDPDASPGVTNKPVRVYIMSGQSNMVGIGNVYGTDDKSLETMTRRENKFPNLVNAAGGWTQRQDVMYRGVISAIHNKGLTAGCGADSNKLGPELGFGHIMGWYHDEPVLLLKSSIGNRSLGWDILPRGTPSWVYGGTTYPGYGSPIPTTPGSWYAGYEFDRYFMDDSEAAHPHGAAEFNVVDVLDNFAAQYPSRAAQGFEIAGFVWWQGEKDLGNAGHANTYGANLVRLINSLRGYYTNRYPGKVAPNAPFVLGTLGEATRGMTTPANDAAILNAHLAVDSTTGSNPQVNVKTVYTNPLSEGGAGNGHYGNRAGTYMLVGDAMGRAMVDLIVAANGPDVTPPTPNPMTFAMAPTPVNTNTVGMVATTAVDVSEPVQYWFENTSNGTESGWITSTRWDSTGLTNGVSQNFRVKAKDSAGNETAFSAVSSAAPGNDVTKPTPDPMTFAGPLQVLGENSISMAANAATDINGVQYEFVCTIGGGPGSGWQSGTNFTATGLNAGTSYTYIVRAKDPAGNTTANSAPASASTIAADTTPPTPATMSFATPPTALGIDVINMTATTASDPSGVEYFFEETSGNTGGTSSGWQNSPTYADSGLQPGTQYTYRVRARDKSPAQTPNGWSSAVSATTELPDITSPAVLSFSPLDGAIDVAVSSNLVINFNEEINTGSGLVTLKNLSDSTQSTIDITDGTQISASGSTLTINPTTNLLPAKNYAVQIAITAIVDLSDNPYAGINDDTTWNFASAVVPHVWTQTAGNAQLWSLGTNWLAGTPPSPIAGDTVDFSTANIVANTTLTLEADRTAQLWKFGDATTASHDWIVNTGNKIILAGTTPTIQVVNRTATLNNVVDGTAGLTKTGGGTLALANTANTYTGGTTINGGNITIASEGSLGTGNVTVNANATINLPASPFTFNRGFTLNNGASLGTNFTSAVVTVNGPVTGTGSIAPYNQSGASLTLASTANTFTGSFQLASGIQQATIIVNSIGDGGTVFLGGTGYGQANFRYGTGATDPLVLSTRTFTLGTAGGGKGVIQNDNTAESHANTITINTDLVTPNSGARVLELGGANTGNNTFAGDIGNGPGTVSLIKAGVGTWALRGTNTYTGSTLANSGTLIFQGTQAFPSGSAITLDHTSGSSGGIKLLSDTAGTIALPNTINISTNNSTGNHGIFVGNNSTANGGETSGTTTDSIVQIANLVFSFAKGDTSYQSVNVTGANGYDIHFNNVVLNNLTGRTANSVTESRFNPTTAGVNVTLGNVTMATGNTGTLNDGVPVLKLEGTTSNNHVTGTISNASDYLTGQALSLIKSNSSTWTLTGSNTYTGATTITGGNLIINSIKNVSGLPNALGQPLLANATISIGATTTAGTLTYTGTGDTTDRVLNLAGTTGGVTLDQSGASGLLKFTSPLTATGAGIKTLTLTGSTAGTGEISGAIVENSSTNKTSLAKSGTGTWLLSGVNSYTGTTAINAGKLFINGSTGAGVVSVAADATLGGNGVIGGNTTIAANGKLEFDLSTPAAGHNKLELANTKTLTFSGTSVLTITSTSGASPGTYVLLTAPGGITGAAPATLNLPSNWAATVSKSGNDLVLNVTSTGGGATYANWASLNSAGANLSDDHDNDGVDNGTEYFMFGPTGNSTGFTALPGVTNNLGTLSVTWTKAAGYTGNYGTHFVVETSNTLVGAWTTEPANPDPLFTVTFPTATEVKYTFPAPIGANKFVRLKVTGP